MKLFTIRGNKKIQRRIQRILIIGFWLLIWWLISRALNREIYLPSPGATLEAVLRLSIRAKFWQSILMTFLRVVLGFSLSCLLGIILGIICGLNKALEDIFNPLIIAIKSTPVMSVIIIALIWFKSGLVPVFVCFLMCFPIIWTNTVEGIHEVDEKLLQMAGVYRVNKGEILRGIYVPSLTPYLRAGIITALGLGWKVTVAAEVLSSPKYSIGGNLHGAKVYLESSELFAWTLVVVVLSFLFEYLFKRYIKDMGKYVIGGR